MFFLNKIYQLHKETIQNSIWRVIQISSKEGVMFILFFIAAKILLPEDFGILSYLIALASLVVIFTNFGISTAASRYTAEYVIKDKNRVKAIFSSVLLVLLILFIVIALLVLVFGKHFLKENYIYFLCFLPFLFFKPVSSVLDGIYRGLKKFKSLSIISLTVGIFSLIIGFFLIRSLGIFGFIISINSIYILLTIICLFFLREKTWKLDRKILKKIIAYSLLVGFASISFFLYSRVDILILKQFDYVVEIGYYELINRVFQVILMSSLILGQVIGPNITRHIARGNFSIVKKKFKKYLTLLLPSGILISVTLYFVLPLIIKVALPNYYTASFLLIINILLILLPLKFLGTFFANGFITPAGFAKIYTYTTFVGGILNVVLNYIFIKAFGFVGVFWVTLILHSLVIIVTQGIFYFLINKRSKAYARLSHKS